MIKSRLIKDKLISKKDEAFHPHLLFGYRVLNRWVQAGAKGDWLGTIVGFNPLSRRFMISYDIPFKDGVTCFMRMIY